MSAWNGSRLTAQAAKIADAVDEAHVVALLRRLVMQPSETGDEATIAAVIADILGDLGLAVERRDAAPGRPNVIGTLAGPSMGQPAVVLNGHMDVVPVGAGWTVDPFGGAIADGRIYGRGATDMKGGIAAMIEAVAAIRRSGVALNGTVVVTTVVGEEFDQIGVRELIASGLQGDYAIVTEPTQVMPVIAHKGDLHYEIKVHGRAAHSSRPHLGVNAIDKIANVIVGLRRLGAELETTKHVNLGAATLSIGTISGGTDTCVVPDTATITVDRRLLPGEAVETADGQIDRLIHDLKAEDAALDISVRRIMTAPAMEISPQSRVAVAARQASTAILGHDPGFRYKHGTTDANWLVGAGIPTVILGPGDPEQAHRANESIEIEQLTKAAKAIALTIADLLGTRDRA